MPFNLPEAVPVLMDVTEEGAFVRLVWSDWTITTLPKSPETWARIGAIQAAGGCKPSWA